MSANRKSQVSLYSIVSAQAGGVSDAILRATAGQKLEDAKGRLDAMLDWFDELCEGAQTMKLVNVKDLVRDWLIDDGKTLLDAWKAGLGLQMGTAFMGLEETYTGYPQVLGIYNITKINQSLRPLLERYWNTAYPNNVPNSQLAFELLMHGQIDKATFNKHCLEDGWSSSWASKLYEVWNRNPDEYLAFSMFKRKLITEAKMYQCFRAKGYDASYDKVLYEALHRIPTLRELITISDYVPLPDLYIAEVLRQNGYTETTVNYLVPAVRLRPLREEVRSVIGRYLWQYQIGRLSRDDLKKALTPLCQNPKELELNMLWGDLRYADELLDEEIEILEARVEYGDPTMQTQEDIFTELVLLGIAEEKANLMAELWYYKYVYVPP